MKQNVILKAAVAAALGVAAAGAYAGQISANPGAIYAKQAVTNAGTATLGQFAYQTSSTFAAGSAVKFVFSLSNGATFSSVGVAGTQITFGGFATNSAQVQISSTVNASGQLEVSITPSQSFASGQLLVVPAGVTATNLGAALGVGGANQLGISANVINSVNITIESGSQQVIATSADAFTAAFSAGPETGKINVANDKALIGNLNAGTSVSQAVIGQFKVTNAATLPVALDGVTQVSAGSYSHTFTVTGKFANSTNAVGYSTATTCAGAVTTTSTDGVTFTATLAAGAATTVAASSTTLYFCQLGDGSGSFQAVQYTGALSATAAGLATVSIAATNMYKLDYNGGVVRVSNFIGSDFAAVGYQGFLRVVNSGTKTADISVAAYDPTTGVLGTSAVVVTALPAGASKTIPTKDIETALGTAFTGNVWRTLQVTGKTDKLDAASLVLDPRGGLTNVSSIQGGSSTFAGSNQ